MKLKSIHLEVPERKPFDRHDWFEAFVGHFVIPVVNTKLIESFWFTRYQDPKKHARLRIRIDEPDEPKLQQTVDALITTQGFIDLADEPNYGAEFNGTRWIGEGQQPIDPARRQELVWNFLTAASALYLNTFSHQDADGYWHREQNHDRGNNIDGDTMESVHHLFCNMTAVDPRVEMLLQKDPQGFERKILIAGTYRRWNHIPDDCVHASQKVSF